MDSPSISVEPVKEQPDVRNEAVAEDDDFVVVNEPPRINLKPESYSDSKSVDKQAAAAQGGMSCGDADFNDVDKQGESVPSSSDVSDAQKRVNATKDDSEEDGCWGLLCSVGRFLRRVCHFFIIVWIVIGLTILLGALCSLLIPFSN